MNPSIPDKCQACGKPLLLENLFVDDGCPCNSARGVNFEPYKCQVCHTSNCVKPGHRLKYLFDTSATVVFEQAQADSVNYAFEQLRSLVRPYRT